MKRPEYNEIVWGVKCLDRETFIRVMSQPYVYEHQARMEEIIDSYQEYIATVSEV